MKISINMNLIKLLGIAILVLILFGCSASTGSRYETETSASKKTEKKTGNQETVEDDSKKITLNEDFDITSYKPHIKIEAKNNSEGVIPPDVWYGYENENSTGIKGNKNIIGTRDGYRVQVISTDNLEEANTVRSEIYFKTNNKEVYINFEPPFYKVKIGDFTDREEANNLKFKLNQLGYSEAKVVQETVNIFSE